MQRQQKKDNALRHRSRDTWVLHSRDRKNNNPAALRSVGIVILSHEAVTVPSVPLNEGKFRPVIKTGLIWPTGAEVWAETCQDKVFRVLLNPSSHQKSHQHNTPVYLLDYDVIFSLDYIHERGKKKKKKTPSKHFSRPAENCTRTRGWEEERMK